LACRRVGNRQALLPRERRLRIREHGLGVGHVGARLIDVFGPGAVDKFIKLGLGAGQPSLRQGFGAAVGGIVERGDDLPGLDGVAFVFCNVVIAPSLLNARSTCRISTLPYSVSSDGSPVRRCATTHPTPANTANITKAIARRFMAGKRFGIGISSLLTVGSLLPAENAPRRHRGLFDV
jgi:hypothetical protein